MKVIALDVETSLREPWTEPTFAPLPLHQVEIACWLVAENGSTEMRFYDRAVDEDSVDGCLGLKRLAADLRAADRLVTWSGRGFDMPLLSLHALAEGVDWAWWEARRHRFPNYKTPLFHFDMQDQLSDYGAARGLSLDRVARLLGLGKQGMHGADVGAYLERGERVQVMAYCMNDVLITYLIYLRWSATHGGAAAALDAYERALTWAKQHSVLGSFYP